MAAIWFSVLCLWKGCGSGLVFSGQHYVMRAMAPGLFFEKCSPFTLYSYGIAFIVSFCGSLELGGVEALSLCLSFFPLVFCFSDGGKGVTF